MLQYPPTLVLNADYRPLSHFPLSTMGWEKVMKAVAEDTHYVVEEYPDIFVRSPSIKMPLPSVIALKKYQPVSHKVAFTRFNVFLRDGFTCQYCGSLHRNHTSELTFDHVVPRCKGGTTEWENIAAACHACNTLKDCKQEMQPMRAPFKPSANYLVQQAKKFPPNYLHETWTDFVHWDTELEA